MSELSNYLWNLYAQILGGWGLYVFGFGLYLFGVIRRSLIKMLTGIIACTVFALLGSWSYGPVAVFILVFQEMGMLVILLLRMDK